MKVTPIIIGLDLGQQNDYTVISALEVENQKIRTNSNVYKLIYLRRWSLKAPYPKIVNWVSWYLETSFESGEYTMIVDYTGVGRPIVDLFRERQLSLVALNITGGHNVSWRKGREVSTPKKDIVSSLQAVFQSSRLILGGELKNKDTLVREFVSFRPKFTSNANTKFEALSGHHDDIVMSIGLPIWYGEHISKRSKRVRAFSGN